MGASFRVRRRGDVLPTASAMIGAVSGRSRLAEYKDQHAQS